MQFVHSISILVLSGALSIVQLQAQDAPKAATKPSGKKVTATGCIEKGVECLRLRNASGKLIYSINNTDKLKEGHAYRIGGHVSDVGICQEGVPILGPEKITEVKMRCAAPSPAK